MRVTLESRSKRKLATFPLPRKNTTPRGKERYSECSPAHKVLARIQHFVHFSATKLAMAKKFNDPENSCKVLVATDAIGMGLNLCVHRASGNQLSAGKRQDMFVIDASLLVLKTLLDCRNIRRIVFYSLLKMTRTADGSMKYDLIEPSQCLQIAGRAGNAFSTSEEEYSTFDLSRFKPSWFTQRYQAQTNLSSFTLKPT